MSAIKLKTVFELMYCSVRLVSRAWAALTFKSEMARRSPAISDFQVGDGPAQPVEKVSSTGGGGPSLTFKSEMARRSPSKRPFRILNNVKAAPTIIPPTAI